MSQKIPIKTSLQSAALPRPAGFFLLLAQLALVLFVADQFLIEQTYGFDRLIPVVFFGFAAHFWAPLNWRPALFLFLFPISSFLLLGTLPSILLIVLGLVLFGLCHLPVSISIRAAILVGVGLLLAAFRSGAIDFPIADAAMYFQSQTLPILSAMFMFRTIVYLYDLRHEKGTVSWSQRLGYFFLFPNVCFPLFPVIDYQSYKRTYFDRDHLEIYQKGIDWILRGITHLLLYRIVYHYLVPDPLAVDSFAEVGQYVLSSFLLYLRVSGLFHLIIGVLCLFGFNLPETHHRYYLSESFTDFWRRINIYWKDFMMKLFYYPIFLRLRGWGMTPAMIAATLITFVITWVLHSYQWFWLRGNWHLVPQDMLFWAILAVLVTANSLYEEKYGRKRRLLSKQPKITPREALAKAGKVVTVFIVICVLWSFWTSASITQWLAVMSVALAGSLQEWLGFAGLIAAAVGIGVVIQLYGQKPTEKERLAAISIPRRAAWVGGAAIALLAVSNPVVVGLFGTQTESLVATITGDKLNTRDQQRLVKGYYEDLLGVESSGSMAWSVRLEKPENWEWNGASQAEHAVSTSDIRVSGFKPSIDLLHKGRQFRTNQWGFRGPEVESTKPADTRRIALLGSSYTVGAGVEFEHTFPSLLQQQLSESRVSDAERHYEVLNFAHGGDSILRRVARLRHSALQFNPDIILDMSTTDEIDLAVRNLRAAVEDPGIDIDPFLRDVIERSGANAGMSRDEIERRLRPFGNEICRWGYRQLAAETRQHGAHGAIFVLPRTGDTESMYERELEFLSAIGTEVGLQVVSMEGVYGPASDRNDIKLAPWDWHPNVSGHERIGRRMFEELSRLDFMAIDKSTTAVQVTR